MTRTLHDGLYLSISPFKLEESFLQATRDFTPNDLFAFRTHARQTVPWIA